MLIQQVDKLPPITAAIERRSKPSPVLVTGPERAWYYDGKVLHPFKGMIVVVLIILLRQV